MNWDEFISSEKASLDTIDVKRIYIDMAGDLVSGVLLSQIVYWHLLSKSGKVRLTVEKDGEYWLAKKRYDWWDECRITPKQFDRSINVLEERQMVITQVFRYNGSPTKHIRINRDVFVAVYNAMLSYSVDFVKFQGGKWILTKGEYRTLPLGNIELPERGITQTPPKPAPAIAPTHAVEGPEITTETTTELINDDEFEDDDRTQKKDYQQHPKNSFSPDNSQTQNTGESINSEEEEFPGDLRANQDNHGNVNKTPAHISPAVAPTDENPHETPGDNPYFLDIEDYLSSQGIGLSFTGKSFIGMKELFEANVPLDIVHKGIDILLSRKPDKKEIYSFNYFTKDIWKLYNDTQKSEDDAQKSIQQTNELLERLKARGG